MKIHRLFSLLLIFLFVFVEITFAGNTGKVAGRVIDKTTGEPLPFANVFISSINAGSASDIDGYYTILNVPPGVYEVSASVVGYKKMTVTEVRVNVDFTTRIDFELEMGDVTLDVITVQGERNPLIRQDLTNPTVAITSETIDELPVDNINDVIKLQAGIVTGNDGNIHIRGGYSNEISYTLNGVSLNDPYANSRSVGLATNAVREVSVSSGTFTAEYGNALSGVVNYVTKEGGDKYSFSIRSYVGDYLSSNDELFDNIDDIDPLNRARLELTAGGPVPFTSNKLKFFVSGVAEDYKGYLYGWKLYNPTDSYLDRVNFTGTGDTRKGASSDPYFFNPYDPNSTGEPTGDSSIVPMSTSTSFNVQGNISWQLSSLFKVKYEALFNKSEWQDYSRAYKYNPDGRGTNYSNGIIQTLDITHTVSNSLFYTLKASYGFSKYRYFLYEDVNDPRYLPSLYSRYVVGSDFYAGGNTNYRQYRTTATYALKGDLVSQLFNNHEVKFGFELRLHRLKNYAYTLQVGKLNTDGSISLTDADLLYDTNLVLYHKIPTSPSQITNYIKYPAEGAAYLMDKIELAKSLVLIVGLRYEYFDSKGYYNTDLTTELEDFKYGYISQNLEKADIKHHLSPRISVSYPITDQGVIRFSYGHFYQNGSLSSLYSNDQFFVTNVGESPTFGNPNVKMQRS
ncbi:MAG: TonB-dependent receptor, partial [Ignavibacteriales bacterium]|nr:TonB-dependent receptor [Ignavibacteriales bacterium]